MAAKTIYIPAGTGQAYMGPGDIYTFLVTGEASNGSYFTMEALVPPGGGPPPHIHHREEEQFYILDGEVSLQAADETIRASAGDFIHIPRGTVHAFRNLGSTPAKMLVTYAPAGVENLFQRVFPPAGSEAASRPMTEESISRFKEIEAEYGLETLPSRKISLGVNVNRKSDDRQSRQSRSSEISEGLLAARWVGAMPENYDGLCCAATFGR